MAVAVQALVLAGVVAEVGARPFRHHGALRDSGDCRGVVRAVEERGIADVVAVGHEADLSEQGGMLKVTVRDGSRGIRLRDERVLYGVTERSPPDVSSAV